jgi:hypothetical protein
VDTALKLLTDWPSLGTLVPLKIQTRIKGNFDA